MKFRPRKTNQAAMHSLAIPASLPWFCLPSSPLQHWIGPSSNSRYTMILFCPPLFLDVNLMIMYLMVTLSLTDNFSTKAE